MGTNRASGSTYDWQEVRAQTITNAMNGRRDLLDAPSLLNDRKVSDSRHATSRTLRRDYHNRSWLERRTARL